MMMVKNTVCGGAPRLAPARVRLWSKPIRVAVTVDDDERRAECGMGQDQPDIGLRQADPGVEEEQARRGDHQRHHHGRDQDAHDQRAVGHLAARQAQGGQGAQHRGDRRGADADDEAVAHGPDPLRIVPHVGQPGPAEGDVRRRHAVAQDVGVPADRIGRRVQRQHARGVGEIRLVVERQRDDHQDRRDQEQQDQAADRPVQHVPDALQRGGIGGHRHRRLSPASACRRRQAGCTANRAPARRPAGSRPARRPGSSSAISAYGRR